MPENPSASLPILSVVVVIHNMRREAPRTLHSLSTPYQQEIASEAYEVVVVENGSTEPLSRESVESLGPNFRYFFLSDASPSPAAAMNFGSRQSNSKHIGCMVDGARMLTPRTLGLALRCLETFARPVVGTLGFHLGPDIQNRAKEHGYDQAVEDDLLASIQWPEDGYRLFEICTLAISSHRGWFGRLDESNCAFMPRSLFEEVDGFEEAFNTPGGGLVNNDFWRRVCELPDSTLVQLLGEGAFHQIHGGAATSKTPTELKRSFSEWEAQYERIRGRTLAGPKRTPLVFGYPHAAALAAAPADRF